MTSPFDEIHSHLHWSFGNDRQRRGKWTARLADESDDRSPVVISCDDGKGGDITMPLEVFKELRAHGLTVAGGGYWALPKQPEPSWVERWGSWPGSYPGRTSLMALLLGMAGP